MAAVTVCHDDWVLLPERPVRSPGLHTGNRLEVDQTGAVLLLRAAAGGARNEGGWYGGAVSREPRPYTLAVVVEPDRGMWHAWCPTLLDYGAATWGATREEALGHIREVVAMVVTRMAEDGVPVPTVPADQTRSKGRGRRRGSGSSSPSARPPPTCRPPA
jgi:predicted RNase H-like HicB family nuclease